MNEINTPCSPPLKRPRGRPKKIPMPSPALVDADDDEILTTPEAAALTKLSVAWYVKRRCEGNGPPYRKQGRAVRYLKRELLAWWQTSATHH